MFIFNNYFDFKDDDDGSNNIRKANLFAVHFKRLSGYHKDWKLQKILLYEYFLVCGRKYGHKGFTQKLSMIKKYTRLSRDTIIKYTKQLEQEGLITVQRYETARGIKHLNKYTINYDGIKRSLHKIYNFGDKKESEIKGICEWISLWYDYHKSKSYKQAETEFKNYTSKEEHIVEGYNEYGDIGHYGDDN